MMDNTEATKHKNKADIVNQGVKTEPSNSVRYSAKSLKTDTDRMSEENNGGDTYGFAMGMSNDTHNIDANHGMVEDECGMLAHSDVTAMMGNERENGRIAMGDDNDGDGEEEQEEVEPEPEGVSTEIDAMTRQAAAQLDKTLADTKQMVQGLLREITVFLTEAESVQRDFLQVQMAVHQEAARLDSLEPQVERATFVSPNSRTRLNTASLVNGTAPTGEEDGQNF